MLAGILVQRALVDWARGHVDQARAHIRDAIARAEQTGRPADRVQAQRYAAFVSRHLRDTAAVIAHEEALRAVGVALNPREEAQAVDLQGCVLVEQGRSEEGIALLRDAVKRHVTLGERLVLECYVGHLAEALLRAGQLDEALRLVDEAESAVAGPSVFRTDTLRLRAEILAQQGKAPASEVEAAFRAALDVAEQQGARSQGLRAATSFARWLREQGRAGEGRDLLAPLYARFTEGFDLADLREAKELLEELG
jgi:tetratricopeptide (TPR) repeat protein